ncbi:putative hydrogenase nickel incorporation protein HypA 2 [uncultured Pleomorphomonas sp.]|uniref:Hydrogenase maturation factor HypA n=1 Tax=uncultured Pleomorphomonas sp. TaxID=442121 RepID=A0A212LLA0_9HYPH|nr:hydrogenase maturation nickel metallochaperone HypA [uncultured Pleomorphomonas sp.]SCM78313.1 putative hydrogenase nickel incorporation protein HypA 2 [uncultured Pleomorphomonas sp.]
MHETAVVEGLMRILTEHARQNGVDRVVAVRLKIGKLRGIDSRQIRLAFEIFAEGTLAEGARLDIDEVGVTAKCRTCGSVFEVEKYRFVCSGCGGSDADVLTGRELYIESFEAAKT